MSGQSRNEMLMAEKAGRMLDKATDPVEKLRYSCLKRGASGILGFGKVFRRMDNDGNRTLSLDEFAQGIQECGVYLTNEEIQDLYTKFDRDGSGTLDYNEFLRAIRPPMSQNRISLIEKAFSKLDTTQDGSVTIEDLKQKYNVKSHPEYQNGTKSEDELLTTFLSKFEENGTVDGVVTKEEFIDYYAGVSASIDDDMYFDLVMRQAWHI